MRDNKKQTLIQVGLVDWLGCKPHREIRMKNAILERIKDFAVKELETAYGYCGVAEGDHMAMINSDDKNGLDIKIILKTEPE